MDDSDTDPLVHFIKQRRNLIIISSLIIVVNICGIQINDFEAFGHHVKILQKWIFYWLLISASGYFFWRYLTAHNKIDANNIENVANMSTFKNLRKIYTYKRIDQNAILKENKIPYLVQDEYTSEIIPHTFPFSQEYNYILTHTDSDKYYEKILESGIAEYKYCDNNYHIFEHKIDEKDLAKMLNQSLYKSRLYKMEFLEYAFPQIFYICAIISIFLNAEIFNFILDIIK